MYNHLLYLIGPPGSGKSTLMEYLVRGLNVFEYKDVKDYSLTKGRGSRPVFWLSYGPPGPEAPGGWGDVVEFGRAAGISDSTGRKAGRGTDRYDKAIHQWFYEYWECHKFPYVLAEGDRLGYDEFFRRAGEFGYLQRVFYLSAPDDVLEERRRTRGSDQNASWIKGRATKAANLADRVGAHVLDSTRALWWLESQIRLFSPVAQRLAALRGEVVEEFR